MVNLALFTHVQTVALPGETRLLESKDIHTVAPKRLKSVSLLRITFPGHLRIT
jgi:hypothetical protein